MRTSIENGLRVFLAVSLLWATTQAPSTVVHRHAQGGEAHDHDFDPDRGKWDLGDLDDHAFAAAKADYLGEVWGPGIDDLHQHACLALFGSGAPVKAHGQSMCSWAVISSVSASSHLRSSCGGLSGTQAWLATTATAAVGGSRVVAQDDPAVVAAVNPPLCDRARHERSGVQLA